MLRITSFLGLGARFFSKRPSYKKIDPKKIPKMIPRIAYIITKKIVPKTVPKVKK